MQYAFTSDDLKGIAELIEKLNNGTIATDMYVGPVPICQGDSSVIGTIEYDEQGTYGFLYKVDKDEDGDS